jgi:putative flippase GtrA
MARRRRHDEFWHSVSPVSVPGARIAQDPAMQLLAQVRNFFGVGVAAAIAHYGLLIGLVETHVASVLTATLLGYLLGGLVSYVLNRRHTYRSERPHAEAGWRFVVVAAVGFVLTAIFMHLFVTRLHAPYLPAQFVTTGIVLVWSFIAHRAWTFAHASRAA